MEDKFLNTEDIEKMLSPQCEFHASEDLKTKVMNEARTLSKPRRLRLVSWLAAACVAGILMIFLTPPKQDDGTTTQGSSPTAEAIRKKQPDSTLHAEAEIPPKEESIPVVLSASAAPVAPSAATPDTTATTATPDEEHLMTIISEADLPITNPENYIDTPADIEQMERLAKIAYINKINHEIEIASYYLQQAQMN